MIHHEVDSSEMAFRTAAMMATQRVLEEGRFSSFRTHHEIGDYLSRGVYWQHY